MKEMMDVLGESQTLYIVFFFVIFLFLLLDLGILVRSKSKMTVKSALIQTGCWVSVALGYGVLVYYYHGKDHGLEYFSAYLMEYSLSADNLFVFIIILSYFKVSEKYTHKVLFYGIIGAIIFRVLFILLGIVIVEKFHWLLYIFGFILFYTGIKMFRSGEDNKFDPGKNIIYKFMQRNFRILDNEAGGNLTLQRNGKTYLSILFIVIAIIASTDLIFAVDSIPAVFAISQDRLVIITSNIFAVMGLRAMFYLLSHAANKFDYLKEGISLILIFIGVKMLIAYFNINIPTLVSLSVILGVIVLSIIISLLFDKPTKSKAE